MKKFDYIVYIGRFQPFHFGHYETIKKALSLADKVIVFIGSARQPRTIKDPFTWGERAMMIQSCFHNQSVECLPIEDAPYNNQVWARWVQSEVDRIVVHHCLSYNHNKKIGIIGHVKDGSSFYLKMFPQWEFISMENYKGLNATDLRTAFFTNRKQFFDVHDGSTIPVSVVEQIRDITIDYQKEFDILDQEYEYVKKYKEAWSTAPYPPVFVTVDAVVFQSGHVLMIRRGAAPGMGQLALPGGFINQEETTEDSMLRELREETKLKVPEPVLRGSIKATKLFDHPGRSLRGRTITNAFLIELAPGELPKVKGGDDARKALWIPLSDLSKMKEQCFEDHYFIINHFLGRV